MVGAVPISFPSTTTCEPPGTDSSTTTPVFGVAGIFSQYARAAMPAVNSAATAKIRGNQRAIGAPSDRALATALAIADGPGSSTGAASEGHFALACAAAAALWRATKSRAALDPLSSAASTARSPAACGEISDGSSSHAARRARAQLAAAHAAAITRARR